MYTVTFSTQAAKALIKMPRNNAQRIREKLGRLAEDPFASNLNAEKLQDRPGCRLRVGDWRVIYEINKKEIMILVLKIASRGEVYQ